METAKAPSPVYFSDLRAKPGKGLLDKLRELAVQAGFQKIDFQRKLVALKVHFGEPGNLAYLRPNYVAVLVRLVREGGGAPFLTDCSTLYSGHRSNAVDHLQAAGENGFHRLTTGCEVIIADGLKGTEYRQIPLNLPHCRAPKIGAVIADADVLISLTHFKGHELTGFGGTLKNLGMGCASRGGKLEMHSTSKPRIVEKNCTACMVCIRACAHDALHLNKARKAEIQYDRCVGCGQCVALCRFNAAQVLWDESAEVACEKVAEYALAAVYGKPHFHFSFLLDISPNCDCWNLNDRPIVPNLGFMASFDPVALDRAAVDLVNQAPPHLDSALSEAGWKEGEDKFTALHPKTRWQACLDHAEQIGLGRQRYHLVKVG
jgi:uncharacterized Fe-S center protein